MPGLNSETFKDAMKTLYMGPLNDQVYRSRAFLNRVEKNSEDVSGNFAYVPLISSRNPAVGGRKDVAGSNAGVGPKLPSHGRQGYTNATFTMGLHYGRGAVSGSTKRKSRTDKGAFARALDAEMKGLMESLPDELNRMLVGSGTGRAATLIGTTNVTASTFIEVNAKDPLSARIGDRVHFAIIATGIGIVPVAGETNVTQIDYFTDAAGVSSTTKHRVGISRAAERTLVTATDAMYFGFPASGTDVEGSSRGQEIYGLLALIDNGDIGARLSVVAAAGEILAGPGETGDHTRVGGLVRTANAFWQSQVKHNSGVERPLTVALMEEAWLTTTALHGANPESLEIYTSPETWGTLGLLEVGGRVYNDYKETVELGFTAIKFNGSLVFPDRDIQTGIMFFLHMPDLMFLTQNDYEMIDDDGNILRMIEGGGRDAWEFSICRDAQLGARRLRTSLQLRDIKSSVSVQGALH